MHIQFACTEASHSGLVRCRVTDLFTDSVSTRIRDYKSQSLHKAERWLSGLKRVPGKDVSGKPDREFESLPLRFVWVKDYVERHREFESLRLRHYKIPPRGGYFVGGGERGACALCVEIRKAEACFGSDQNS